MHCGDDDDVHSDKSESSREARSDSMDIMPGAHDHEGQSAWLSGALDSLDEDAEVVSISFAGGRLSARRYERSPLGSSPGAETLDETLSPEGAGLEPRASLTGETAFLSLDAALRMANARPGVDLVVVLDKNGTLLFDHGGEDAALIAAFVPLFHDSSESLSEMFESLTDELPHLAERRLKLRFYEKGGGAWYICAVGLPSCDLGEVIGGLVEHMDWLLG